MKHIFYSLLTLAAVLGFQSCVDDTIGSSLTDTRAAIIEDSSFVITGHSVPNQRIMARTSTQLVGLLKADGYGTLSSEVVTQFIPSTIIDTMGVSADMIDSCRLMLTISPNGFTGDAQPPMRLSVYRLKEQLPTPLYSDFDPTDYYDESGLLGSNSYSPKSTVPVYYETSSGQIEYEAVYVPMPVSLAREIQTEYRQHPETFSSPTAFAKFFPGMYFKNSYGSGRVMNFVRTEFQVFYRKRSTILETDTTTNNTATYMAATPETLQDNIISLDVDASVKQRVADGQAIILAPAGYEVQVRFPIQEIIDKFNTDEIPIVQNSHLAGCSASHKRVKHQITFICPSNYLVFCQFVRKNSRMTCFLPSKRISENIRMVFRFFRCHECLAFWCSHCLILVQQ